MSNYTGDCWNIETTADTEMYGFHINDNIELFPQMEEMLNKMSQKVKRNFPDFVRSRIPENWSIQTFVRITLAGDDYTILGVTLDIRVHNEQSTLRWYYRVGSEIKESSDDWSTKRTPNRWALNFDSLYYRSKFAGVMTLQKGIKRMKRREAALIRLKARKIKQ